MAPWLIIKAYFNGLFTALRVYLKHLIESKYVQTRNCNAGVFSIIWLL